MQNKNRWVSDYRVGFAYADRDKIELNKWYICDGNNGMPIRQHSTVRSYYANCGMVEGNGSATSVNF